MKFFTGILLLLTPFLVISQANEDNILDTLPAVETGLFPKAPDEPLYRIKVGGYYRFFGTYTYMKEPYLLNPVINDYSKKRTIFIGDDSQLPNITFNISGRPTKQTAWGFDLYMFQFLDGDIKPAYSIKVAEADRPNIYNPIAGTRLAGHLNLHLGINLYGSFHTSLGSFNIRFGGIHWISMTDLTLASFKGYNRFILFEPNPWDPLGKKVNSRYEKFYKEGNIDQDARWGEKAFQGLILDGLNLPGNLNFMLLFGKTELNGGFLTIPNFSYGGMIRKALNNDGHISLNTFNGLTYKDSLNTLRVGFNMITTEVKSMLGDYKLQLEIGGGRYFSPSWNSRWGEAISAKFKSPLWFSSLSVEAHFFRLSPYIINNSAVFFNTSIEEEKLNDIPAGNVGSTSVLQPFASAIVPLGMMTNNRQGYELNFEFQLKKLKMSLALGSSSELKAYSNQITFGHPVNQLTRSRFWRWNFPADVGPYQRYNVIFRDVYESLNLKDDSLGVAIYKKQFSGIEIQAKYNTKIFYRNFYLFLLNRYYTAQKFYFPVPVFSERAYLRQYSHELEGYYQITRDWMLSVYGGIERNIANYDTKVDFESQRPLNQTGWGLGLGMDYSLAKNAMLFIRHRWFYFNDSSFALDHFKGTESLVELKIMF